MWSRIVDDGEAASAGGGVGAEAGEVSAGVTGVVGVGVDEAVDVGVDAAVVVGPLICGDGACGTGCKLPGVRQSPVGCRCARICGPNLADFHGRCSRCTTGNTCAPRSIRCTVTASCKAS